MAVKLSTWSQPDFDTISTRCQFKIDPISIWTQPDINSNSTLCRVKLDSMWIQTWLDVDSNSTRCRFKLDSMSIQTRLDYDSTSIQFRFELYFDPITLQPTLFLSLANKFVFLVFVIRHQCFIESPTLSLVSVVKMK